MVTMGTREKDEMADDWRGGTVSGGNRASPRLSFHDRKRQMKGQR